MSNAHKFSPQGSPIHLAVARDGQDGPEAAGHAATDEVDYLRVYVRRLRDKLGDDP